VLAKFYEGGRTARGWGGSKGVLGGIEGEAMLLVALWLQEKRGHESQCNLHGKKNHDKDGTKIGRAWEAKWPYWGDGKGCLHDFPADERPTLGGGDKKTRKGGLPTKKGGGEFGGL